MKVNCELETIFFVLVQRLGSDVTLSAEEMEAAAAQGGKLATYTQIVDAAGAPVLHPRDAAGVRIQIVPHAEAYERYHRAAAAVFAHRRAAAKAVENS